METPKLPLAIEQAKELLNKIGHDKVLSITLNGYDKYTYIHKIIGGDLFHISTPYSGDVKTENEIIYVLTNIKHGVYNFDIHDKY